MSSRRTRAVTVALAGVTVLALGLAFLAAHHRHAIRVTLSATPTIWGPQSGDVSEIVWCSDRKVAAIATYAPDPKSRWDWNLGNAALEIIDTSTGRDLVPARRLCHHLQPLCFSPDGSTLAVYSQRLPGVLLWDIRSARPLWSSRVRTGAIEGAAAAFSADGRHLTVRCDRTLVLLDTKSGRTVWSADISPAWFVVEGSRDVVHALGGRGIVVTSSTDTARPRIAGAPAISLEERSLSTGRFIRHIATVDRPMHCIAWSPDGTMMSANSGTELQVIRTDTLAVVARIDWRAAASYVDRIHPPSRARVRAAAFSPDGKSLAFTVSDGPGVVCVYSIPERRMRCIIRSTGDAFPYDVEFAGDGKSLLTIGSHALYRWVLPPDHQPSRRG